MKIKIKNISYNNYKFTKGLYVLGPCGPSIVIDLLENWDLNAFIKHYFLLAYQRYEYVDIIRFHEFYKNKNVYIIKYLDDDTYDIVEEYYLRYYEEMFL